MKRLDKNRDALNYPCPYCGAKPGERCKVIMGTFTVGSEPRDKYGHPQIHNKRIPKSNGMRDFSISNISTGEGRMP